ncbi:putative regulatory protein, FmdB family [Polaromonas sp. CF318]|uniref:FmdB family zinc ribbon protein n=1 Tax=Polaromonas sp. CF318 TaxID=1144318 RepID=UPI0002711F1E|nr:FmdB family zinc ribbon protein [Polaromonas sp. CF318]EJL84438.1 putative regulatory protein, FmdB family [Polaromonas sp. CF318]
MPIYAYKCESCGHAKDVLQKISDAPLTVCPQCGAPAFKKQVTAAGFQLKGSGWYVTDFRGGNSTGVAAPKTEGGEAGTANGKGTDSKPADSTAPAPASTAAAPAPAPAAPAKASAGDSSSKSSS